MTIEKVQKAILISAGLLLFTTTHALTPGIEVHSLSTGLNLVRYKKLSPYPRPVFVISQITFRAYEEGNPFRMFSNFTFAISNYNSSKIFTGTEPFAIYGGSLYLTPLSTFYYIRNVKTILFYEIGIELSHGYIYFSDGNLNAKYSLDGIGIKLSTSYIVKILPKMGLQVELNIGRYVVGAITENYRTYMSLGLALFIVITETYYACRLWKF